MIHKLLLITCLLLSSVKGIDNNKLRHGNLNNFKEGQKVYLVDSKKIYLQLKPYKTIIKKNLKEGSAEHNKLMMEATTLYKDALSKSGYSLIVELDGVNKTLHKTEDVTQKIISLL